MSEPSANAPKSAGGLPKKVILFVILSVAALIIIFALLATIGDDVPNDLPPATETSPGN